MSETAATTTAPVIPAIPLVLDSGPIVINRNSVDQPYKMFKFLKGDSKGAEYPCPDVLNEDEFDNTVAWFSKKVVLNVLQNFAKAVHQKIRRDCTDEATGIFDLVKALRKYAAFDVAGLTLKAMADKITELQEINGRRVMEADVSDYESEDWRVETKRRTKEILDLMAELEEKKASNVKDADTEPSVPS